MALTFVIIDLFTPADLANSSSTRKSPAVSGTRRHPRRHRVDHTPPPSCGAGTGACIAPKCRCLSSFRCLSATSASEEPRRPGEMTSPDPSRLVAGAPHTWEQEAKPGAGYGQTTATRWSRSALLAVVFVCAACGLVYELALVSLGSVPDRQHRNPGVDRARGDGCSQWVLGRFAAEPLQPRSVTAFAVMGLGPRVARWIVGDGAVRGVRLSCAVHAGARGGRVCVGSADQVRDPLLIDFYAATDSAAGALRRSPTSSPSTTSAPSSAACVPFLLLPFFGQLQGCAAWSAW